MGTRGADLGLREPATAPHGRDAAGRGRNLLADAGTSTAAYPYLIGYHRACEQQARDALGRAAFDEHVHKGQTMSAEDAIIYALGEPADSPGRRQGGLADGAHAPRARGGRTRRPRAQQQGDLRGSGHLPAHGRNPHPKILNKLGFTRTQVPAWVAAHHAEEQAR